MTVTSDSAARDPVTGGLRTGDGASDSARFQLAASGPEAYHRYLVPAFFAACADQMLEFTPPQPADRILDVACGTGAVSLAAARRTGPAARITGLDLNAGMLSVADSVASESPVAAITWMRGDAAALTFPAASFDVVYCQQGLQFFPDHPAALAEMRRVLAPGGRLGVSVWRSIEHHPAFAALAAVLDRYAGGGAGSALRSPFAGPSAADLRSLAARTGFDQVRIRIGILAVRFPSVRAFLRHEAAATPAAPAFAALDEKTHVDMEAELTTMIDEFVDDDGVAFAMQTWHLTARA